MDLNFGTPAATNGATANLIKDSDTKNFKADVIDASRTQPVIDRRGAPANGATQETAWVWGTRNRFRAFQARV